MNIGTEAGVTPKAAEHRPSAIELMHSAINIQKARAAEYEQSEEKGERSMAQIVTAFNAITGRTGERALTESEGWQFMSVLKQVRSWNTKGAHVDSLIDGINYAALQAEARIAGR